MKKTDYEKLRRALVLVALLVAAVAARPALARQQAGVQVPPHQLKFGVFVARFNPDGTFTLQGDRWPSLGGNWRSEGGEIVLATAGGPEGCGGFGRYRMRVEGERVSFDLVADDCRPRRMILDRSTWSPVGVAEKTVARRIVRTAGGRAPARAAPGGAGGSWPSFRGPQASGVAERQNLPDRWDGKTGENVLWRTPIPGLAHSSPVVWGGRVFVTSAVSGDPKASFRPGLYGDGDASTDRTRHRWVIYALDKRTGKVLWERTAHEGVPVDKRHIKSTYANSTPATDGRIVVAWFGSQGVHAYDVNGRFLWKVDLGRLDLGAYDIPTYEWGPASSPVIWNGLVIIQCDTQQDSFVLALDANTGKTVWKTEREELPSWGTPTVAVTPNGPELVANASNFIRGYDPSTGRELWRLGRSSKITAPTPVFADGVFVVVSGRAPERPIFVVRPGARGDLTLPEGKASSEWVAWSRTGRGSYMPTPLVYGGILYVLSNNGLLDAYDLRTGEEVYRQRLPLVGSSFSASPVAAVGKLYLSNEDGEMLVIAAGKNFEHVATNSMGELLMATPALSDGVMYVRSASSLFAVGRKR
ncbi:MAG TPA: PQQ-binding-like beta-propeller repeat protein [Pyrinomonadaceae bacterium]|nr:PQQ-binding-like beta-propeller repeat protein [Pyrinomonadaceae bacterium]